MAVQRIPKVLKVKLETKIILAVSLVLALVVGSSFLLLWNYQRSQLIKNAEHATFQLSNTVKGSLEHAMLTNNPEEVQKIVETVGKQEGIERVLIINREGVSKIASLAKDAGQRFSLTDFPCVSCHQGKIPAFQSKAIVSPKGEERSLWSGNPILNQQKCQGCHVKEEKVLGVLLLSRSMKDLEGQLAVIRRRMLLSAGVAFIVLATTLSLALRRLVIRPVSELARAADTIGSGDLEQRIVLPRRDELGTLAITMDEMREKLKASIEEIKQWGEELEKRVRQRTEELSILFSMTSLMGRSLDLGEIFRTALEKAMEAMGIGAGLIVLWGDEEGPSLVVHRGLPEETARILSGQRINESKVPDEGISELLTLECVKVSDSLGGEKEICYFACVPIISKEKVVGKICLANPEKPFPHQRVQLLRSMAEQIGVAIEKALLYKHLQRSYQQLQDTQEAVLEKERRIAALETLKQTMVTLSHYINNAIAGILGCNRWLVNYFREGSPAKDREKVKIALEGIDFSISKITATLKALEELTRIDLTTYIGKTKMIDIEKELEERLKTGIPENHSRSAQE